MVMTLADAIKDLDLSIYAIQHTLTFTFSRLADPPIVLRVWLRTLNSIQSISGATKKNVVHCSVLHFCVLHDQLLFALV